jgi:DNA-directed RNA polymerase subunit RPC12/RpoP
VPEGRAALRQPNGATITCPMCGSRYPEREPEEPYACTECGGEGLDCCVPGSNSICVNCETREP